MIEQCFSAIEKIPKAKERKILFFKREETEKAFYIKEIIINGEDCIFESQKNKLYFYNPCWIAKSCLYDIQEHSLTYEEIPKKHYYDSEAYKFITLS